MHVKYELQTPLTGYMLHVYNILFFPRSTVQKLENNMMSIMQTITYAHDRMHVQGTGWLVPFDLREWN